MPKLKLPHHSPRVDMTPMVDLFSLLLTFFMLTTSFRPQEAAVIDTPASISEKLAPEKNVMTFLVSKEGKVYFSVSDKGENPADTTFHFRSKILDEMGKKYSVNFTKAQLKKFENLTSFGMPIAFVPKWIDAKDQKDRDALQAELVKLKNDGIPYDSANNQMAYWIFYARSISPNVEVQIKGDVDADYKDIKKILDILQDKQVNKFNLTTNLEKVDIKKEKK
jgi:biopolymer transport protein ExbD